MKKLVSLIVTFLALTAGVLKATDQTAVVPAAPQPVVQQASDLNASLTAGYESQYVFRGLKQADAIGTADFQATIDKVSFDILAIAPLNHGGIKVQNLSEVDTTLRYSIPLQAATLDVGGVLYMYPQAHVKLAQTQYTTEEFVGLTYKAFLSPSVTAYYDNNRNAWTFEGKLSQPLAITSELALVPSVAAGYVDARNALPDAKVGVDQSYRYAGGALNVVYSPTKNLSVSVGERYSLVDITGGWAHRAWTGATLSLKF
jgi:hypothetical protein